MSTARRFALMLLVLGAISITLGLSGTLQSGPTQQTAASPEVAVLTEPAQEALPADPFFGQETISSGTERACNACFSLPCTTPGERCGQMGSGCRCKTCNGQFNCFP